MTATPHAVAVIPGHHRRAEEGGMQPSPLRGVVIDATVCAIRQTDASGRRA
ncbi:MULTISPECIES: hypothetical protein [Novacetimonas]|uniref:Uncharacterized protein n=1 Tax=Novacetimonas hansenii TaxID=436 RepID=A0AAW5ERU4_NOVHA|nr:hypothetical protein [Novacetimonas hansenii]MCJ8353020.1 hypothetical protein [Novacetimonas hansenii]